MPQSTTQSEAARLAERRRVDEFMASKQASMQKNAKPKAKPETLSGFQRLLQVLASK